MAGSKKIIDKLKEQQYQEEIPKDECSQEYNNDKATITTKSLNISTLDEALEYSKVDLNVWEVDRYIVNSWEVTMGGNKTPSRNPEIYTNYQVKVWLKRKVENNTEIAIKNFFKNFKHAKYPEIKYKKYKDPIMLEIGLYDHHFGKLAWGKEVNNNYDLNIAKTLYSKAITDILNKTQHYNTERIVFPIGQDFFNIDNEEGTTKKGTRQDIEGRFAKIIETGIWACIKAIEQCLAVAPTKIIWVPGNHDYTTSYMLCKTLQHHFWPNKNVEFDVKPNSRKYQQYGINLIGYTHLSEEKIQRLPLIMADEEKEMWAQTKIHEWHTGHLHKKREIRFIGVDSEGSVTVRTFPSLCGVDFWHYQKGFVGGIKACESYLWNKKIGYVGHFSTNLF